MSSVYTDVVTSKLAVTHLDDKVNDDIKPMQRPPLHRRKSGSAGIHTRALGPKVVPLRPLHKPAPRPPTDDHPLPRLLALPRKADVKQKGPIDSRVVYPSGYRYGQLHLPDGPIVISNSFARGTFGKVCWGFLPDDVCAVKVWHFTEKGDEARKGKTTAITPLKKIEQEIANTIIIRHVLDRAWPNPEGLWTQLVENVDAWRLGFIPFQALGAVACTTTHKAYFAMTRELMDMYRLHYLLLDPSHRLEAKLERVRKVALRCAAMQLFVELAKLHNIAGKVHNDISLANVFVNECLQFKLFDFGTATQFGTSIKLKYAPLGSLVAPELVTHDRLSSKFVQVTGKEDIFDLAAMLVQFSAPPNHQSVNPFGFPQHTSVASGESKGALLRKTFEDFDDWKARLLRPGCTRLASCDVAQDTDHFGTFFAPLASSDPALCDILLNDAMQTQPTMRKDAVAVAYALYQATRPEGADKAAMEALKKFLGSCGAAERIREMAEEARDFSLRLAG